jgi:transcriptional regulator with XRE-family HTH domain
MGNFLGGSVLKFAERVSYLLAEKDIKQNKLAAHLGVPTSTLNNWLKLGRDIPPEQIIPICEFLGVSIEFGLTGEKKQAAPDETTDELVQIVKDMDEDERKEVLRLAKKEQLLAKLLKERAG